MKAIIFDFDGVIHDTLKISHETHKAVAGEMTLDEYKDIFNGNLYAHKSVQSSDQNLFFSLSAPKYEELVMKESVKHELLKFKEHYDMFIITSNKESILRKYFERNNCSNVFKEILGFETHKSKVDKFMLLFEKHHLTTGDCVFVTDTLGDIIEANKLGIRTIAVDFGFHDRERLMKGNPEKIVSSFADIRKHADLRNDYSVFFMFLNTHNLYK